MSEWAPRRSGKPESHEQPWRNHHGQWAELRPPSKPRRKPRRARSRPSARVRDQVDQRSTQAGERVGSTAQDIRSVGEELREQGKDQPAKLAEQAAQRAESLGDYLQRSDGDTILRDVEDFGRRQPWAVIAGGVALGFAASRFLKASSRRRYESARRSRRRPRGCTTGAPTSRTGLAADDVTPGRAATATAPPGGTRRARRAAADRRALASYTDAASERAGA